jgi:hypothetical protein
LKIEKTESDFNPEILEIKAEIDDSKLRIFANALGINMFTADFLMDFDDETKSTILRTSSSF